MNLPKSVYMVGIGGIGMSALAQLLHARGAQVSGSDRSESPTTDLLLKRGITVSVGHDGCLIPAETQLLIYSDAVWPDNPERIRATEMKIPQMSYFEALGTVAQGMRTIAVAGTHGKTTTTGMLAKLLHDLDKNPTAVVGSIVRDFPPEGGSNYLAGADELLVVEGCEYRDHLLELNPEILVITNIELDHTDFFPSLAAFQNTFRAAVEKVPRGGVIVTNPNDPNIASVLSHAQARIVDYTTYAVGELLLPGEFNRENARAALAAAKAAFPDIEPEAAVRSLSSFRGSWRRFEYKGATKEGALVYDDYAHHPTAVQKTIAAAREKFPDRKIIVAFHPHLFSRTRDLMDGFAAALATADEVVIAPIFPAREKPIEGVTSDVLANKINTLGTEAKAFSTLEQVYDYFTSTRKLTNSDVLFTVGAGDIYHVAEDLV